MYKIFQSGPEPDFRQQIIRPPYSHACLPECGRHPLRRHHPVRHGSGPGLPQNTFPLVGFVRSAKNCRKLGLSVPGDTCQAKDFTLMNFQGNIFERPADLLLSVALIFCKFQLDAAFFALALPGHPEVFPCLPSCSPVASDPCQFF